MGRAKNNKKAAATVVAAAFPLKNSIAAANQ
jgi:hypothetical protein